MGLVYILCMVRRYKAHRYKVHEGVWNKPCVDHACVYPSVCVCRLLVQYSDPLRAGGSLAVVDPASGTLTDLHTPFTSFGSLSVAQVRLSAYVLHCICDTPLLPGIPEKLRSTHAIWQDTSCYLWVSCMSASSPTCFLDLISCHYTAAASIHAAYVLLPTMFLLPML